MTLSFSLPKWYDLHAHFRQGDLIQPLVQDHVAMGCVGILAMPNTKPPVAKVLESDPSEYWSVERYKSDLKNASGDDNFEVIAPLYITKDTTPQMIEEGAKSGHLKACKYYPPHGTTGADLGYPLSKIIEGDVFRAMEENNLTLCLHGEEHGMDPECYFDRKINAEEFFYTERMPRLLEKFPNLKMVGEHITTKIATDFITNAPDHVGATITPQHLLYTVGHLLKGLHYHLYCLPLLKFDEDRDALRKAVKATDNTKFFAGTDSAPHTNKMTPCGCAAGCYTGGIAPQLYAQGFEEAGIELATKDGQEAFKRFLSINGAEFYGLPVSTENFTLTKTPQITKPLMVGEQKIVPLPNGLNPKGDDEAQMDWSLTL